VISPRSRELAPCPFGGYVCPASRMAVLGLCLWAMCLASSAAAADNKREKPYAVIFGTVWGPDDHPLYGVRIRIRREGEKKARWDLYSDHNGEFAQHVPAGKQDYVIWADLKHRKAENHNPLHGEEVKVHIDGDERVDTGLHLK
jgi:hypothetical protein